MLKFLIGKKAKVIKTADVLESFLENIQIMKTKLIPNLEKLVNILKEHAVKIDENQVVVTISNYFGFKPYAVGICNSMITSFQNIVDGAEEVEKVLKDMPKTFTTNAMTVKQITVMKIVNDVEFLVSYSSVLIDYFLSIATREDKENVNEEKINRFGELLENSLIFTKFILFYENSKYFKSLKDLDETYIQFKVDEAKSIKAAEGIFVNAFSNLGKGFNVFNFNGSPFLFIGMLLMDYKVARVKAIKARVDQHERKLSLLELQVETGETNSALEKEISYYSEEIAKDELKLKKLKKQS